MWSRSAEVARNPLERVLQASTLLTSTLLIGVLAGCTGIALPGGAVATPEVPCPVTLPDGSMPPGETVAGTSYGNGLIWTALWPDGKVIFKPGGPGAINPDGSLSMKWFWWRGVTGKLVIEGRRLDAAAPPLRSFVPQGYGDAGFQASDLTFPSPGCWEVTGRVGDAALKFVTIAARSDR